MKHYGVTAYKQYCLAEGEIHGNDRLHANCYVLA